jgi:hypothetical protein
MEQGINMKSPEECAAKSDGAFSEICSETQGVHVYVSRDGKIRRISVLEGKQAEPL